jgi:hemerythrin-like domain-containing protein
MSPDVRKDARQIVAFFEGAAHEHHAEEDRLVFPPLLEGSDVALSRQVRRLQQDHAWLEQDRVELKLQLDAVAKGYSWHDVDALRANVGVFTGLYFDHIDLEESLIYPNARRRLSERANAGAARLAAEQQRQRAA